VNKQKSQDLTWETSFDQIVNATNQGEIRTHHPWILFMLRFGEVYQKLMSVYPIGPELRSSWEEVNLSQSYSLGQSGSEGLPHDNKIVENVESISHSYLHLLAFMSSTTHRDQCCLQQGLQAWRGSSQPN